MEIGGGYLVWQWIRERQGIVIGLTGGIILFLYGIIPTFQPSHFGRIYVMLMEEYSLFRLLYGE